MQIARNSNYHYPRGREHSEIIGRGIAAVIARLVELYGVPRIHNVDMGVSWLVILVHDLYPEIPIGTLTVNPDVTVELPLEALEYAQNYIDGHLPAWVVPPRAGLGSVRILTALEIEALWGPCLSVN